MQPRASEELQNHTGAPITGAMNTEVLPLRHIPTASQGDCATRPIASEMMQSFRIMFAHADAGVEHAPFASSILLARVREALGQPEGERSQNRESQSRI